MMLLRKRNNILVVLFVGSVIVYISTLFWRENDEIYPLGSIEKEEVRITSILGSMQYFCKKAESVKSSSGTVWDICIDSNTKFLHLNGANEGIVMFSIGYVFYTRVTDL